MRSSSRSSCTTKHLEMTHSPLEYLYAQFTRYIEDRRRQPRDDVMTGLATATFPDGSLPPVEDVMKIASNLFAAGQETTARLLGTALQTLAERPELQQQLRDDRSLVSPFIEETLAPGASDQRHLPPVADADDGAGHRDPGGEHGHGPAQRRPTATHASSRIPTSCASTARTPASTSPSATASTPVPAPHWPEPSPTSPCSASLDRMADIRISESHHGPAGARHWEYTPTWMLRGHDRLYLEFTPID